MSQKPSHARPSHTISTPRLTLRSALPSDAGPFCQIRSHLLNNPFGGVVNATISEEKYRDGLDAEKIRTSEGKNAFINVILKDSQSFKGIDGAEELRVSDGYLIGMSGFNTFFIDEEGELVGDTGALIDYRFTRRGFAVEVLEAVFEYGFNELGCGKMFLETNAENEPFRGLMRIMGLGEFERDGTGEEESVVFTFGREKWEAVKSRLKENGKWYLG